MNRKTIAIGVTAAAALLVTGWVIAQTTGRTRGRAPRRAQLATT